MLVRCLYASRTEQAISPHLLDQILEQSRRNNARNGITGLLCSTSNVFVQAIEGGRDEVSHLFTAIVRDPRHTGVRLLSFEEITQRVFGNWTMGQANVASLNPSILLKYGRLAELDPFDLPAHSTFSLLVELSESGGISRRTG